MAVEPDEFVLQIEPAAVPHGELQLGRVNVLVHSHRRAGVLIDIVILHAHASAVVRVEAGRPHRDQAGGNPAILFVRVGNRGEEIAAGIPATNIDRAVRRPLAGRGRRHVGRLELIAGVVVEDVVRLPLRRGRIDLRRRSGIRKRFGARAELQRQQVAHFVIRERAGAPERRTAVRGGQAIEVVIAEGAVEGGAREIGDGGRIADPVGGVAEVGQRGGAGGQLVFRNAVARIVRFRLRGAIGEGQYSLRSKRLVCHRRNQ